MKSMQQMGEAMIRRAAAERESNGTEWPRPVIVGIGVVAIAYSQDEADELKRTNRDAWVFAIVVNVALIAALAIFIGL